MDAALLDTDILNEVLKQKNAKVVDRASDYLQAHGQFAIGLVLVTGNTAHFEWVPALTLANWREL